MDVSDRRLSRGQQIELAATLRVQTFLDRIGLIFKFRELADADHALAADDKGRRDLRVPVFGRVQVQEELNESPFQLCSPMRIKEKTAPGQFRASLEID